MAKLAVLESNKGGSQEGIVITVWKRNNPIILGEKTSEIFLQCVINLRVIVLELLGTYLDTQYPVKILPRSGYIRCMYFKKTIMSGQ